MLDADLIRANNPRLTRILIVNEDCQSDGDCDVFIPNQPAQVRPLEEDQLKNEHKEDGNSLFSNVQGPSRAVEADNIGLLDDTTLCNACTSALGYLVQKVEESRSVNAREKQEREDGTYEESTHNAYLASLKPAVVHHGSCLALQRSMNQGCRLCTLLWFKYWGRFSFPPEVLEQSRLELAFNTDDEDAWLGDVRRGLRLMCIATMSNMKRERFNYHNYLRVQLWRSPHNDRHFPNSRKASVDLSNHGNLTIDEGSTRAVKPLAIQWLTECEANVDGKHSACNAATTAWLPTRLLDVSSLFTTGTAQLISTSTSISSDLHSRKYITLSHCWGEWGATQLHVLTQSNISQMLTSGVSLQDLPDTFQHAAEIAQWFNINYIWIDSLCIIQDSPEDWEHEANLMCEVYKNALLNISADDAFDARIGCIFDRDPSIVQPFKVHFKNLDTHWWFCLDERGLFDWIRKAPIFERAWVLQERQLSRRVLHFTHREVFWECCSPAPSLKCETFPKGTPFQRDFLGQTKLALQDCPSGLLLDEERMASNWDEICVAFSRRKLTVSTDKLPALAGIAKEFGTRCYKDQYLAGLWRSTLIRTMLWGRSSMKVTPVSQVKSSLPSWSWLVSNVSVKFPPCQLYHGIAEIHQVTYDCKPARYSAVGSASMEVRCFVRAVTIKKSTRDVSYDFMGLNTGESYTLFVDEDAERMIGSSDHFNSSFNHNFDAGDLEEKTCYFLYWATTVSSTTGERILEGLLAEEVGEDGTMRRIGTLSAHGPCAMRLRYRVMADTDHSRFSELWKKVKPYWGGDFPRAEPDTLKDVKVNSEGPRSMYEFDGDADTTGFESLTARDIILI